MASVFDSDALYRRLIEQVEDYAIFALDVDGKVQTWNPGAQRFKGYTAEEIIGKYFSVFYPPEAVERGVPSSMLRTALQSGSATDEGWRVRKDGTRFWASVTVTALKDDAGRHVGFAKITRDLTQRRDAEERLRQLAAQEAANAAVQAVADELETANEQLRAALLETEEARDALGSAEQFSRGILESIADPFVVLDAAWRYQFLNAPAAHMIEPSRGVNSGGVIGRSMWELYPDIAGTEFDRRMRQAMVERTPLSFEAFYPRRSEWSLLHCYPLPDGGLAIQWRDITDRKRTEEASHYLTQASDILNRSLVYEDTLNDLARLVVPRLADWCGVEIGDESGVLRQVAVAHVDPEKVRFAKQLNERYPPDPGDPGGAYHVFRTGQPALYPQITDEMLAAGARDPDHLSISRELGLKSAIIVPLTVGGSTLGVLTLVSAESGRRYDERDMILGAELAHRAAIAVENARLHRVALTARHAAEEANRAKSAFLATMSHELRTPLNAIGGYVDLLRLGVKGPVTPEQDDYLARIERSEKHLLSLIQDVLSFARIEAGRVDLRIESSVAAQALLDEVSSLVRPQMDEAQLRFEMKPSLPDALLRADPERVRQILLNLLTNAIKFTPPGGEVIVWVETADTTVSISVRDTGSGIPREKQESIFEPFIQLERNTQRGRAGVGLGLAISRDLARAMDGTLTVESEVERGSTFRLSLPRG